MTGGGREGSASTGVTTLEKRGPVGGTTIRGLYESADTFEVLENLQEKREKTNVESNCGISRQNCDNSPYRVAHCILQVEDADCMRGS